MKNIEINQEKCIKCGLCIKDCIAKCIEFNEEKVPYMAHQERCISCQHCLAICPTGALSFNNKSPENSQEVNYDDILSLIKSRRSVRQFKDEEISDELMQKIKGMLPFIPTGCHSHSLHISIVTKKNVMKTLRDKVNNKIIKILTSKAFSPLAKKFERYKAAFLEGEDVVFRGAPHLIVVSSPITAPCATVDPIIALSYIELYANNLGLGTCWCGYAHKCIQLFPELCEDLEIPSGYTPVYAMLLGIPSLEYKRTIQPEPYKISEISEIKEKDSCIFCKIKRFITNFLR